jgi:alpha-galactosidase
MTEVRSTYRSAAAQSDTAHARGALYREKDQMMKTSGVLFRFVGLLMMCAAWPAMAQVDYTDRGPWNQRADAGPDEQVPGWFYNLGITGLRAQLIADEPRALLIKYVFPGSPADGRVMVGDVVVGAGGRMFQEAHRNGYGMKVFGADGPISELAEVLEACQSDDRQGILPLTLRRGGQIVDVSLDVGTKYGTFAPTYPQDCRKSDLILRELLEYLVKHQQDDGSFGNPIHNTFAPLALLASGEEKYLPAVERNVRHHIAATKAEDMWLVNWFYMSAAIVLSEYELATGEGWVLPELQRLHDLIAKGQYLRMSQINPKAKESHPGSFPKGPEDAHGGWGHNPGFEGYGPIAMLTGQGALAYALMHRCGIAIDRANHDAAYNFLKRGAGENGYVWYGDQVGGGPNDWADMGRTGAAGIAYFLSPYEGGDYRERALLHAGVIGKHPQSFPDTHGSPAMGMAYAALAASIDAESFRSLMDANRWWFTMAHCTDGSFYYQPNRDNAGYGSDSRMTASSVTAFILAIAKRSLVMTGKEVKDAPKPAGTSGAAAKPLAVFILAGQSNMQGHAAISTFGSLASDPKTAPLLREMIGPDGSPVVCEAVWISSVGCLGDAYSDLTEAKGQLTAGFGAPEEKIGPELTFGLTMAKVLDQPILIIKTSWGGRSLHTDFRPPSAGPFVLAKETQELWDEHPDGAHGIPQVEDRPAFFAEKTAATGVYYREMIAHIKNVLGDIKRVVPDYDESQGYELAGFVWFQGFNDYVDGGVYPRQDSVGGYDRYADLLGHFIRDVRNDLSAAELPFVIGVMGIDGMKGDTSAPMMHFREAQRKPSTLSEFKGTVFAVETAPFWDDTLAELHDRMEGLNHRVSAELGRSPEMAEQEREAFRASAIKEQFTPEELDQLRSGVSNGGYHYLGAAKIIAPIGQAFAEALIEARADK